MIVRYSIFVRPDLMQVFWARMQAGDFISEAVEPIKTSRRTGRRILSDAGGVRPRRGRDLKGRCLSFAEREEIALRRIQGQTLREIGAAVGRSASTISRELDGTMWRGSVIEQRTLTLSRLTVPHDQSLQRCTSTRNCVRKWSGT